MTLKTIFKRLADIDQKLQTLIRKIGMDDDCEFLYLLIRERRHAV